MQPKPAEIWRHFKGALYVVVGVSRDSEAWDDESARCVIYFNLGPTSGSGQPNLIHRPLSMWTEHVEREDYSGPRYRLEAESRAVHTREARLASMDEEDPFDYPPLDDEIEE